ncbi:unnamed protein product [Effrenium voratum]|nr:unnamed protein product [Effrenium voratum]
MCEGGGDSGCPPKMLAFLLVSLREVTTPSEAGGTSKKAKAPMAPRCTWQGGEVHPGLRLAEATPHISTNLCSGKTTLSFRLHEVLAENHRRAFALKGAKCPREFLRISAS